MFHRDRITGVSTSPAPSQRPRAHSRSRRRWFARPSVVVSGWILAHGIPLLWIMLTGKSTGDIRYYHQGVTGARPGAMDEYPEMGTWPARIAEWFVDDETWFTRVFIALNLLASALFTLLLAYRGRGGGHGIGAVWFWILFAGVSGPIFLTRLDLFPGLLTAGVVALLFSRSRLRHVGPVLLSAATMMKLWPGVLGAALVGGFRRSSTWVRVGLFFGSLLGFCVLIAATGGIDRLVSPLTYQGDRGLQIESLLATPLMLAAAVHGHSDHGGNPWNIDYAASKSYEIVGPGVGTTLVVGTVLLVATIVLALGWASVRLIKDDRTPMKALALSMLLILLIIATNKVFSPQYLAWIAPVVAVALVVVRAPWRSTLRVIAGLVLVAAALTTSVYPVLYGELFSNPPTVPATLVLTLRNITVLMMSVACAWWVIKLHREPGATAPSDG